MIRLFAKVCCCWIILFYCCTATTTSNSSNVHFGKLIIENSKWNEVKKAIQCWSNHGNWIFNNNKTIFKDLLHYTPCINGYKESSPCPKILEGDGLKYDWMVPTDKCAFAFESFSTEKFCHLLSPTSSPSLPQDNKKRRKKTKEDEQQSKRKNILIVGDSVSSLYAMSLQNELLLGYNESCPKDRIHIKTNSHSLFPQLQQEYFIVPLCENNIKLYYYRNDRLSTIQYFSKHDFPKGNHETPWIHLLDKYQISLLILNAGAHYLPDEQFIPNIQTTMKYLQEHYPDISIIWRNTPHGTFEPQKTFHSPPLQEIPKLSESEINRGWNYHLFQHQNELIRQLLEVSFPQVLYVDVFRPSVLREDSHDDYLHPCVPGYMTVWSQFIYNAFLQVFQQQQQQIL